MAIYTLLAPAYRLEGAYHTLPGAGDTFADERLRVTQTCAPAGEGLTLVRREWRNVSDSVLEIQPVTEAATHFAARDTLIPCVSYNGNRWGGGGEPKGLVRDNVPWVFAGTRSAIPACTLSEDGERVFALFASAKDEASLRASCSLVPQEDGAMRHRILYPVVEEPLSYIDRDTYGPALEDFVRLRPGECLTVEAYCYEGTPPWPHFGAAALLDAVAALSPADTHPARTDAELWTLGIAYAKHLVLPWGGRRLLGIGCSPGEAGGFEVRPHFEVGWCGQNALYARMLIRDWMRFGHRDSLDLAIDILDAWAEDAVTPTGLMAVHFEKKDTPEGALSDTCNLGYAAAELLRSYRLLKSQGIDKPRYLSAAKGICDFFVSRRDGSTGFGKAWDNRTGACVSDEGTVGAFLLPALIEMYRFAGEERYLACAERAFAFYDERDLRVFQCTAGALDTDCVDKETVGPLVWAAVELSDLTGNEYYRDAALRGAYYFCSFLYGYRVPCPADSDFAIYGFSSCGATAVSVQHHHLDAWGVAMVPAFERLAQWTGDLRWHLRAKSMWDCYTACVAGEDDAYVHGRRRPAGSQNEGWMHCRWNSRQDDPRPGGMNDWLVAWPGAFRLMTLDTMGF